MLLPCNVQPGWKNCDCDWRRDGHRASHRNSSRQCRSNHRGGRCEFTRAQKAAATLPNESFAVQADVSDAASVGSAVERVLKRTGRIDILVNNAGIAGPSAHIWEQTDADWQRNIAINLTGVFNFCRAVVPHMRSRAYGRIVNMASIAGKEGNPRMVPYSATKAGVIGLTKSLGKEVATEGICVNAVDPAVIQTQILDQLTPEQVAYMTEKNSDETDR